MSYALTSAVFHTKLRPTARFVLAALADHASDDGTSCHPGNQRLMRYTGYAMRTVQGALTELEETGWITPVGNRAGGKGLAVDWELNAFDVYTAAFGAGWVPPRNWKYAHAAWFRVERVQEMRQTMQETTANHAGDAPQQSYNNYEPDSLRLQQENPRQPSETAGRYAARIAALIATADAPTRPANQTSTGTETDATNADTSPPPSSRQPTVRTRSDDQ